MPAGAQIPKLRTEEWGAACSIDLAFSVSTKTSDSRTKTGSANRRLCQGIEVITEAIEVIYAFAVDAEPSEVSVSV